MKQTPLEDVVFARAITQLLQPFFGLSSQIPARCIQAFCLVASEEGLSVARYAERADISVSTMSRNLLDMGDHNRWGEKGHGLIYSHPTQNNQRELEHYLTPKGRELLNKIATKFIARTINLKKAA